MVLIVRVAILVLKNLLRRRSQLMTESVLRLRVWPTDIDLNFHLNDGRYVSISGLGRLDVMLRTRLLRRALKRGWYPVVGSVVVRYRREIRPFEKFELHSRILGWDDKWFYFEHRFEKGGDVAALAYARGVMRTHGGAVPTSDVLELVDWSEPSPALPDIANKFL